MKSSSLFRPPAFALKAIIYCGLLVFSSSLCAVAESKLGYIDNTGKLVIPALYEEASEFHEGLAQVKLNGKLGYINKSGVMKIKPDATIGCDFSQGLAAVNLAPVQIGSLWGYIDRNQQLKIKPSFENAYPMSDGMAAVHPSRK